MCETKAHTLDLKTPRNVHLSAFYKRSFAHHTVKNRMPVILTEVIDGLARAKEQIAQQYGVSGQDEVKAVIGELSKLKYEIQTNKPLRELSTKAPDAKFYNDYICSQSQKNGSVTFFSTIWLLAECYMYRRIREAFELTEHLQQYDPFAQKKQDTYLQSLPLINNLSQYLLNVLEKSKVANKDEFCDLLKINLWGNKCDLSLSNGVVNINLESIFNTNFLNSCILSDDSSKIWSTIFDNSCTIIDFVCDNSGYEIFTDLCLADYIISKNLASVIRFHVKSIPWFVSDVMVKDFLWILNQLSNSTNEFSRKLGQKWSQYMNKQWFVFENDYWTLPVGFSSMASINPELYKQLSKADLVIFKGDLNYRKLFNEKNWDPVTSIDEALQNFNPAKLCTLRTMKADIVCGLPQGLAEKMDSINEKWMETGDYGLIQFSEKIFRL